MIMKKNSFASSHLFIERQYSSRCNGKSNCNCWVYKRSGSGGPFGNWVNSWLWSDDSFRSGLWTMDYQ